MIWEKKVSIDVVYLAYYNQEVGYTVKIVEDFLNSYQQHPAGIKHSLVIIAKNWNNKTEYEKLCKLAKKNNAKIIDLPDDGWDFGAYFRVSKMLDSDYVMFFGSSVKILSNNWLYKHYNAFKTNDANQLVAAMGSWGYTIKIESFPNYHIRTCSFMMKRELFLEYASSVKFPVTKEDTYELEHGDNSITKFVLNKGYNAVVVNSNGEIFNPDEWVFSDTFRTTRTWKSMFSDKQSLFYYTVDDEYKEYLERAAWGRSLADTRVKIFVSYHNTGSTVFQSEVFQPIFNGAAASPNILKMLKDNMGVNISVKNKNYGELSGHYYLLKNLFPKMDTDYIGFCHYRRFLDFNLSFENNANFPVAIILDFQKMFNNYTDENIYKCVKDYDVVLPHKLYFFERTLYEQFIELHPQKDIDIALEILDELYPEYSETAKKVMSSSEMYTCLTFVMKRELLLEYMEWNFSILELLEQRTDWSEYSSYEWLRTPAFIAERFFNIWLAYNIQAKGLKVLETTSVLVDSDVQAHIAKYMAQIEELTKNST